LLYICAFLFLLLLFFSGINRHVLNERWSFPLDASALFLVACPEFLVLRCAEPVLLTCSGKRNFCLQVLMLNVLVSQRKMEVGRPCSVERRPRRPFSETAHELVMLHLAGIKRRFLCYLLLEKIAIRMEQEILPLPMQKNLTCFEPTGPEDPLACFTCAISFPSACASLLFPSSPRHDHQPIRYIRSRSLVPFQPCAPGI